MRRIEFDIKKEPIIKGKRGSFKNYNSIETILGVVFCDSRPRSRPHLIQSIGALDLHLQLTEGFPLF